MANLRLKDGIGKIEIIYIGSGKGGNLALGDSNIIIKKGNIKILVDLGNTIASGSTVAYDDVNAILPTSLSPDHIGGLASLLDQDIANGNKRDLLIPENNFRSAF